PFDGVIVDIPYFTEANRVNTGTIVAKIMDYRKLYMEFQLPEKNLAKIKVNQPVRVFNYALPEDTLSGIISQLSPAISPDTRNFKGILTISNNNLKLRPGSYIKAQIVTQKKEGVIVIPKDMILSRQRGKTVFVIDRNTAYERVIKTGLENPGFVEVTEGLRLNDRVVSKGFETLSNRTKVKIIQ
ncbi:MAG: efflux RND transporter periplasmic adaptor subunit, partial [Bacteroidales bacterium]|nr:efflux RND transporter periplasmic adaptor subunit [Bacteroidales bacterium]